MPRFTPLLTTFILLAWAACSSPEENLPSPTPSTFGSDYVLVVPDNGSNRVRIFDGLDRRLIYNLDLNDLPSADCSEYYGCFIFGADHVQLLGHDHLDLSFGHPWEWSGGLGVAFEGQIARVMLTVPPVLRWRLRELNFSALPGGSSAYCAADPANPCQARSSGDLKARGLCWVGDAHDFEVLSDDPTTEEAELLVADTDNFRLMRVRLRYHAGNTCGEVLSVLDHTRNAAWAPLAQPNNLTRVPLGDRRLYLVTQRSLTLTENALDGRGVVELWEELADDTWVKHWTFPTQEDGQHTLLFPHGGELIPDASGPGLTFRLADSASLTATSSWDPYASAGGSIALLHLPDPLSPPNYLEDLSLGPGEGRLYFPRAITKVDESTSIITDSGCISGPRCSYPVRLLWVDEVGAQDSSRQGYWSSDHSQLFFHDLTDQVQGSLQCGLVSPYWTQVVWPERLGPELTAARASPGYACE